VIASLVVVLLGLAVVLIGAPLRFLALYVSYQRAARRWHLQHPRARQ